MFCRSFYKICYKQYILHVQVVKQWLVLYSHGNFLLKRERAVILFSVFKVWSHSPDLVKDRSSLKLKGQEQEGHPCTLLNSPWKTFHTSLHNNLVWWSKAKLWPLSCIKVGKKRFQNESNEMCGSHHQNIPSLSPWPAWNICTLGTLYSIWMKPWHFLPLVQLMYQKCNFWFKIM